ncbi:PKD domain containing protein [Nitzschia inconspicua]|uniref:PKD domain containing protein n=1 Tax=Nitzschia inconspicua TaxID=303405 RepID=A0A9K3KWL0_9STRA|nr:PKD domain containing protein [Nitzschia inconspicua]
MSLLRNVHTMKWFLELSLVLFLPSLVISLPKGFIAQVVTSTPAVSGIFAPNPRKNGKPMLLLIQKEGKVKVLEDPDESPDSEVIFDLSGYMCTETERGLHSITIHPDFESNLYVYLYYTKFKEGCLTEDLENGPWNVLTRFTMDIQTLTLDYDSREEIWRGASTHDAIHNGGGILFGNDGKLYLTTGDSGTQDNAQDLKTVHGSIIRLNEDGSIPNDNPFLNGFEPYDCVKSEGKVPSNVTADNAVCAEIFAYGLRNPFRVAVDPSEKEKVCFVISDVGARVWEELSYAGTDYSGRNYGYKTFESEMVAAVGRSPQRFLQINFFA